MNFIRYLDFSVGSHSLKFGDVPILGDVLGAGASVYNTIEQSNMNDKNIEMQKETNRQNYKMFQESQDFTKLMWDLNNEYNDPKNMVKRLQHAGINPAIGQQFGQASLASSPSAPTLQAPQNDIRAHNIDLATAFNAVSAYHQNRLYDAQVKHTNQQTRSMELDNEYNAKTLVDRVKRLSYLAETDEANRDFYRNQAKLAIATYDANKALAFGNLDLQRKQLEIADKSATQMQLSIDAQEIENTWLPVLKQDEHSQYLRTLDSISASIALTMSNKLLTDKQREHECIRMIGTKIDNGMKGIDYAVKEGTKKQAIQMVKEHVYQMEDERFMRPVNFYQQHLGKAANYSITPGSASATATMMDRNNKRDRFGMQHNERFRPKK